MTSGAWFITGASQGLGRSLVEALLKRGERVAATARRPDSLRELAAAHPDTLWLAPLDVTSPDQISAAVAGAIDRFGRVAVLVNNAGYGLRGAAEEVSDDELWRILETNLVGPMALVRAFLPHFREQGGGQIFQVSTQGGQVAFAALGAYHASKWGLEGYTEALAQEVAAFKVGVTIVEPGGIRTAWGGASMQHATPLAAYDETIVGERRRATTGPGRRLPTGDPDKMAEAIIEAMDHPPLPLRLFLGSDTIRNVRAGLESRLAELTAQADRAGQTDAAE